MGYTPSYILYVYAYSFYDQPSFIHLQQNGLLMRHQKKSSERSKERSPKKEYHKKDHVVQKERQIVIYPKTENQKLFLQSINENVLTLGVGAAGTGKTYLAVGAPCKMLRQHKIYKIVISRPNIAISKSLGFFPGDIHEKLAPWLSTMIGYMKDFTSPSVVDIWIKNEQLELLPFETIRGRSFKNTVVIVDECQNLSMEEIKCLTTRIGENSKLILCGDHKQSDLKSVALKSFSDMLIVHDLDNVGVVNFTIDDCVRSDLCGDLLRMFEKENI